MVRDVDVGNIICIYRSQITTKKSYLSGESWKDKKTDFTMHFTFFSDILSKEPYIGNAVYQ